MLNLTMNLANILAQVNFGANSASLLGIFLYFAGAALCSLGLFRSQLARNHDILFAQAILLCALSLIFQGWRLDPILQFGELILVSATVVPIVECIRLRNIR